MPATQFDYFNSCNPLNTGRRSGATLNEQWTAVTGCNPSFVFFTGWNEWGAQNINAPDDGLPSSYPDNRPLLTDLWNQEYSTDFEPMWGGHGTFYYDRMREKIALYKRNTPNFALRNSSTGVWSFKYYAGAESLGATNFTTTFGWAAGAHYQPFVGDFDNDGYTDIGLRDYTNGAWHFARRVAPYQYAHQNSFSWVAGSNYTPIIADFDNDGHTDIGLRDTSTGAWYFARRVAPYQYAHQNSFSWAAGLNYRTFVGDFNRDGHTDIGLQDYNNGVWYLARWVGWFVYSNTESFPWAAGSNYQPYTGEWDGVGKPDIGLRDTSNGNIFALNNSATFSFGNEEKYLGPSGSSLSILVMPNTPDGP